MIGGHRLEKDEGRQRKEAKEESEAGTSGCKDFQK